MADMFVGPIIEKLIDIGFEYLKDQIRWQTGMKDELESLRKNHPHIQAVVEYASSQLQIGDKYPGLNKWLWQLRDAIDEADDVMEELEYLNLQKQLIIAKKPRKVRSIMRFIKKRLVQIGLRALKIDPTLKRLEEVVDKLDEVSAGVSIFLHLVDKEKQDNQELQLELYRARETGSSPTNILMGRDKEKEAIMEWLRKTSNDSQTSNYSPTTLYSNISLLSVVGKGGMGKTALLQDIYNKEDLKNYFDLKFWVCVSNNFDVTKVIADMLESLTKQRPRLETLDALQKSLESEVKNKKFMLVLDDIWEEENKELNKSKWEKGLTPLASGKLGSKILVTTRMDSVAVMLSEIINKDEKKLRLEGLNDDECLQLLYNRAFKKGEDPTAYPKLRPIARKMVEKLSGSPLATKVIGGVLSSRLDETHWNTVLNYEIGGQKDILDILKLSYIFLPKFLRNCYSFCCTFPQDFLFYKDDLVPMWIALGFIQPDNTRGETMKNAGERYFDTLVQKSLIDEFVIFYGYCNYKLHDLLHQMLRTTQECLSIVSGEEELISRTPKTIRHLFVRDVDLIVLRKVEEFKHLRSFILFEDERHEDLANILAKTFKILRSIRLIYISSFSLKIIIPKEIEDLIHLQYLKIDCFKDPQTQVSLPAFWQLPFLKYLFLSSMPEVKEFDYKFHGNDKVRVFPSLQVLHIRRLKALEDWFVAKAAAYECLFPCLIELYLKDCPNLLELPAGLPPMLEKLVIDNIGWKGSYWLQGIISTNYCNISIQGCPNLISLSGHQEMDQTAVKCQLILSELVINDPSLLLKASLTSVTSIQELVIEDNDEVISSSIDDVEEWFLKVSSSLCALKFISLKSLQFLPSFLKSLSSLETLHVQSIPQLQLLPNMPASLKNLTLLDLESLQYLPSSLSFTSLEHLCLGSIPLLRKLPDLPPSLCDLRLIDLSNLYCLPSCLHRLISLNELYLVRLPQLRELPDLPPFLELLLIWGCHPELERYQRDTGSDWHKIAHIPHVEIEALNSDSNDSSDL